MNNFMRSLKHITTKQIDEKIYARIIKALKTDRESYTEREKEQIEKRCLSLQEIFVNFDENMYKLERYKQFITIKTESESETKELDMKIGSIIREELEQMYKETLNPKEQIQVSDRMVHLMNIFKNFDNEILIIQRNNRENKEENNLQEKNNVI